VRFRDDKGATLFGDVQTGQGDQKHGALRGGGGESAARSGHGVRGQYDLAKPFLKRFALRLSRGTNVTEVKKAHQSVEAMTFAKGPFPGLAY